jgi:hypothetical protein
MSAGGDCIRLQKGRHSVVVSDVLLVSRRLSVKGNNRLPFLVGLENLQSDFFSPEYNLLSLADLLFG